VRVAQHARRERLIRVLKDPGHPIYDKSKPLQILHFVLRHRRGRARRAWRIWGLTGCVLPGIFGA
jgi:hypothetical protein